MQFKDYYATMGVAREASADEIKQAYRKLARKYHPDVSKEAGAEQRFKEVGEAYEVLRDPQKRAAYDQLGSGPAPGESFQPPPDWGAGFGFGDGGASAGQAGGGGFAFDGDPSEFFETLFGRAGFAGAQRHASGSYRTTGQGPGHHARVVIDLDASLEGGTRSLTLRIPDTADGARTRLRERTLNVKIPRGILAGQHIRLAGQGQALPGGGAGDLYLEVAFAPHPLYQPDGRDLHIDLPVAPWEAALGATVAVPTPGTRVELKIPPASKTGTRLRLRARGLPATPPGDLYVTLQVVLPPADTEPMRQAYRQLETASAGFDPRATRGESA